MIGIISNFSTAPIEIKDIIVVKVLRGNKCETWFIYQAQPILKRTDFMKEGRKLSERKGETQAGTGDK